jgi:hypothetical protein
MILTTWTLTRTHVTQILITGKYTGKYLKEPGYESLNIVIINIVRRSTYIHLYKILKFDVNRSTLFKIKPIKKN